MVPSLSSHTTKRLKSILDVITNVVVILFATVAIGVLVNPYLKVLYRIDLKSQQVADVSVPAREILKTPATAQTL